MHSCFSSIIKLFVILKLRKPFQRSRCPVLNLEELIVKSMSVNILILGHAINSLEPGQTARIANKNGSLQLKKVTGVKELNTYSIDESSLEVTPKQISGVVGRG